MQSPQPMQNILYHEYLSNKRSKSKEISFSQRLSYNVLLTTCLSRLSHNVFLKTSFSQRISHNVFPAPLSLHIRPHNVIVLCCTYILEYLKFVKTPVISTIFGRSSFFSWSELMFVNYI